MKGSCSTVGAVYDRARSLQFGLCAVIDRAYSGRVAFIALLGVAALFAPFLIAAQAPARLLISGVVRNSVTGELISGAKVTLNGDMLADELTVRSDGAGRFAFPNLPEDNYTISAQRIGFVDQSTGCCDTAQPVILELRPTGVVSGVVVERGGTRLPLIPVQLWQKVIENPLEKEIVARTETNDRGEYRFHDVTPGTYFVSAGMMFEPGNTVMNRFNGIARNSREIYLRQFHPGEFDLGAALPITVAPGREATNVDFALLRQLLVRIRGTLTELQTGKPPATARLSLKPVGAITNRAYEISGEDGRYEAATGMFELRRVFPGAYTVIATGRAESASRGRGTPNAESNASAAATLITVGEADLDGVALTLAPAGSLVGRITVEGQGGTLNLPVIPTITLRPALDDVAIELPNVPSVTVGANGPGRGGPGTQRSSGVQPDGNFRIENLYPVSYRLVVQIPTNAYYTKEAAFAGIDALKHAITISGLESGPLQIILASRPSTAPAGNKP